MGSPFPVPDMYSFYYIDRLIDSRFKSS